MPDGGRLKDVPTGREPLEGQEKALDIRILDDSGEIIVQGRFTWSEMNSSGELTVTKDGIYLGSQ